MKEKELGKVLKSMRLKRGLSAEALSRKSGVSAMHIGRIERGGMSPTLGTLNKIALGLNVEMALRFREKGKKKCDGRILWILLFRCHRCDKCGYGF